VLALVLPLAAQPKLLVNAQVKTLPAGAGLETAFRALLAAQPQPAWIGYSVPAVRTNLGCEYVRDSFTMPGVVHLEPPDHAVILFRVEANAVNRIRSLSPDCEIDAGGLPFYWLTDVQPAQSVALLLTFVSGRDSDSAVGAIAQHADPAADQALDRFLAAGQPKSLRQRTVTLLGSTRGRNPAVVATLLKVIESDPDTEMKRRAVSALHSLPDGAGIPLLIQLVKTSKDAEVRKQAMSTLGTSRDPRATAFFEEILKR